MQELKSLLKMKRKFSTLTLPSYVLLRSVQDSRIKTAYSHDYNCFLMELHTSRNLDVINIIEQNDIEFSFY